MQNYTQFKTLRDTEAFYEHLSLQMLLEFPLLEEHAYTESEEYQKILKEIKANAGDVVNKISAFLIEGLNKLIEKDIVTAESANQQPPAERVKELDAGRKRLNKQYLDASRPVLEEDELNNRPEVYEFKKEDGGKGNFFKFARYDLAKFLYEQKIVPLHVGLTVTGRALQTNQFFSIYQFCKIYPQLVKNPFETKGDAVIVNVEKINGGLKSMIMADSPHYYHFGTVSQFKMLKDLYDKQKGESIEQPKKKKKKLLGIL